MTPEELFQKTKDLPEEEKQKVIRAFLATVDEDDFTQQMLAWGNEILGWMKELQKDISLYKLRYCALDGLIIC